MEFSVKLHRAALSGTYKRIILDFYEVEVLSPESAILIVAEIHRCSAFLKSRTVITGTYPRRPEVAGLLTDIGFFKAIGIKEPALPAHFSPRSFVEIKRGNQTNAELADRLLDCFTHVFAFAPNDRRRLQAALVECMDNVFEHAYEVVGAHPYLVKEWWLAGFADRESNTISFTFLDQGAGIPTTIRQKQNKRIFERLSHWSDARWLDRAVEKGVSRLASKRRGYGLTKLNEFVKQLEVEGSLTVLSNLGAVIFPSTGSVKMYTLTEALTGTLVTWQLTGIRNIQMPDSTHDR